MNTGTVKFYNHDKGYGFIKDAKSSEEYFVHNSGLLNDVRDGDNVSFDLIDGKKGLNAVNVKLV
jgi:CspA family cold shock protein